jgi:hypothetical protein
MTVPLVEALMWLIPFNWFVRLLVIWSERNQARDHEREEYLVLVAAIRRAYH